MPSFTARRLEIADEYYVALSAEARQQVDVRVAALLENPYGPEDAYDPITDQWITTYGDGLGLIVYAIVAEQRRVLMLRLVELV